MKPIFYPVYTLLSCILFGLSNTAGANAQGQVTDPVVERYYQTKTPYQARQTLATYQALPSGYSAVYTQMLARHGSRGLTGPKSDLALYNLWLLAQKDDALTALGTKLGPDIFKLMQANLLLGYGIKGISKPGYGNETQQGINEHLQLAERMYQRLPALFSTATEAQKSRKIIVLTSGKDRAVDSGYFFVQSLIRQQASLQNVVVFPPSLAPAAEQDHQSRPVGTDRFLLYFHKLGSSQDKVSDPADPLFATYQASQAYQRYAKSSELRSREEAVLRQPQLAVAARVVLQALFKPAFIAALDQGKYHVSNEGSYSFTSSDGKFTDTLRGDGDTEISSSVEAAMALYDLYSAAADMQAELNADFTVYIQPAQASIFASVNDGLSFYAKGPGMIENADVTYRMAGTLLKDFFDEVDAIAKGDMSHAAKLRFAHAETVIPMAAILGIKTMSEQQPRNIPYSYESNPWRGEKVAPMAANIQWDVYRNAQGHTLVKMYYNEKETHFKTECDAAQILPGSFFYDYAGLKNCYLHQMPAGQKK
ncbi:histidine-type phosphatase [Undibacterium sp. CY18W]|uniref:Multiple inositol polyphosphate phosphatase 1 n=1 Tax=Undibacterium hunanense TaxID=2762292 RepID=A0ABR6ZR69_9BURK|nr:histidine-type phosphatase [Undibacterium hunanense]MBC3918391.1 histidine-type phosphatase [Undibacterium hunanense]